MFLKRLEVIGFKSFAEQMNIDFVPGVTAVVGPNGSGKSNISDGIRWVLGEQSAKSLRGSKMEDIIFAGSDTRKPLNFAEITLVLDNEDHYIGIDYSEVSVTRRVYRSGDSEYLLNRQTCRLKDIVDLFMDSGLGREAYSIIGQGKVEEILSSKSEDRRVIFEDAAGVLKYKNRKIKAERKLAETQENLFRVEDILHELEGQVEPLQIQASVAKDYLQKKAELKDVEVALMVYEIDDLHKKWSEHNQQFEKLKEEKTTRQNSIEENEAKLTLVREQLQQLDEEMNEYQDSLLKTSEELEKNEGQKEVLKERKKNFTQNKDQLLKTINNLKEEKLELGQKLNEEIGKQKNIEKILVHLKEEMTDKNKALALAEEDLEAELDRLKSDYIEVLNEQASIRNETRYLKEQLHLQEKKVIRIEDDNKQLITLREEVAIRKNDLTSVLLQKQGEVEEKVKEYRNVQLELEQKRNSYQKQQSKLYEAYQLIQQVRSRKEVLEEMQADFSGFFQGVKEILRARGGQLSGIVGAVAELVKVPKEYETALEISLGGATQHIVVETEEQARRAIQFLKQKRYGRATFLPLPAIKGRYLSDNQLSIVNTHPSFVGVASDLINFDKKYEHVISNLLGHVIIATDLQGANEIARLLGFRNRIVTVDGDVVNPGGSMTGGSIKQKTTPLLGRSRELESLTDKLVKMEETTSVLENYVKDLKQQVSALEVRLEKLRVEGEGSREAEQEIRSAIREIEMEEKNVNERLLLYDREHGSFTTERQEIENRLIHLEHTLTQTVASSELLEKQVSEIEEKKKLQKTSKETVQEDLIELKVELAKEEERLHNQKETVQRLSNEEERTTNRLKDMEEQYWLLENEMTASSTGEETIEDKIERNRKRKDEAIHSLSKIRHQRQDLQQKATYLEDKLKLEKGQLTYIMEQLHDKEVLVNRLDVELENRLSHIRNEYELSYEAAKEHYHLTLDVDDARTKVKLIKLAIEELGHVNLGAIEEFERVNERFQFLSEQKNDLTEAKETLYNVIAEMDEEMTKRFEQTFTQIRAHFQVVFRKLFGGGEADLVLSNPDQLLHTGVDIVARPPGKKLQHLALLSGGERALTAIALLFAILKVRPVPFCVLDEVEAALDEANVSRFAAYLKEFSSHTQFIVITHRKGTMEEADVLYGVTMQESGVSKLVSVRLEETEKFLVE
ncbi:chromosome segregation protein SMC [Bacillus sp. FJAT-45350]|uniref:chromosome segregation protein SMC n=1 Tax=Bacillus sp. FJAT-45350 TaxID=2011014 RepID=UPI000BB7D84D|nr:chromosome segregation protein SMC [Bacillus sp. FJAT-45350]